MLDIIVFVAALVVAQVLSTLIVMGITMKLCWSKRFIKMYTKKTMEIVEAMTEEEF